MTRTRITGPQREAIDDVLIAHRAGQCYRAASNGQRPTLANLYRAGVLERRVWRGRDGEPDAAHEYQLGPDMRAAMKLDKLS